MSLQGPPTKIGCLTVSLHEALLWLALFPISLGLWWIILMDLYTNQDETIQSSLATEIQQNFFRQSLL